MYLGANSRKRITFFETKSSPIMIQRMIFEKKFQKNLNKKLLKALLELQQLQIPGKNFHIHKILFLTSDRITTNIVIVVSISGLLAYGNGLWVIMVQQLRFVSLLILYWT